MANNKVAYDVSNELEVVVKQWQGLLVDEGGRGYLARQFFDFNKKTNKFVINREKMQTHPYRKRFQADSDMSKHLIGLANSMNSELNRSSKIGKTHTDIDIEQKARFNGALGAFSKQQGGFYFDSTLSAAPNKKEREEILMRQDPTDIIGNMLWKTAKMVGDSEEKFKAMSPEKQKLTYLDPLQRLQLAALEKDFSKISMTMQMAYPHEESSRAELKEAFKEMTSTGINNRHTSAAVNLVAKFVGSRIDALGPDKIWTTALAECKEDMECANKKLNKNNIDPKNANLVTPANEEKLSNILNLNK